MYCKGKITQPFILPHAGTLLWGSLLFFTTGLKQNQTQIHDLSCGPPHKEVEGGMQSKVQYIEKLYLWACLSCPLCHRFTISIPVKWKTNVVVSVSLSVCTWSSTLSILAFRVWEDTEACLLRWGFAGGARRDKIRRLVVLEGTMQSDVITWLFQECSPTGPCCGVESLTTSLHWQKGLSGREVF